MLSLNEAMFSVTLGPLFSATLSLIIISVDSLTCFCGNAFDIPSEVELQISFIHVGFFFFLQTHFESNWPLSSPFSAVSYHQPFL